MCRSGRARGARSDVSDSPRSHVSVRKDIRVGIKVYYIALGHQIVLQDYRKGWIHCLALVQCVSNLGTQDVGTN